MIIRYLELDFIRGIAIILMIIFHTSFDLNYFHFIEIDIYNHQSQHWAYFRDLIVSLFLGTMGISLSLAYKKQIHFKKFLRHISILFVASLGITLTTYIVFPKYFIYFGILHFITLASLLALPFIRYGYTSLFIGIVIILSSYLNLLSIHPVYSYIQPILSLPLKTKDLVPFFPWFGVVLIGIFIGDKKLFQFPLPNKQLITKITFLGQHSLAIYLIHQPLLFGLFMFLS